MFTVAPPSVPFPCQKRTFSNPAYKFGAGFSLAKMSLVLRKITGLAALID